MSQPIIGWESTSPVPNHHQFNHFLHAENGRLFIDDFDLMQAFELSQVPQSPLPSPLEIVYLPLIRQRIDFMRETFKQAIEETGYEGVFHYAYASKANAAEEVIRTTLSAGAHHEMSSTFDVDIARLMVDRGLLPPERMVICNGFKPRGSHYMANIIRLKRSTHANVIPIVENLNEIAPLTASHLPFEVGLRQKSYGNHASIYEMNAANSRFGLSIEDMFTAADMIEASPNLIPKMYHGMTGSQLLDEANFVDRLRPPMEIFARLCKKHPTLDIFNFGGGIPIPMTLDFDFDYKAFVVQLLTTMQEVCAAHGVNVPDIMGEFGRYTTAEHGVHIFKIAADKTNESKLPWYIIDGSIMSSFPDAWALGEHFIVLPLNHLDKPFQQVQLGGMTCDSDDVYPPKPSKSPLYLPVETEDLYIGFFSIGAYQEMLGGVRGSKHCMLPEAYELIIDKDATGHTLYELIEGQDSAEVLRNLGYQP
ncbi:MAG: arginine decarboxylase [Candidatus Promineifilaceae bacterium]